MHTICKTLTNIFTYNKVEVRRRLFYNVWILFFVTNMWKDVIITLRHKILENLWFWRDYRFSDKLKKVSQGRYVYAWFESKEPLIKSKHLKWLSLYLKRMMKPLISFSKCKKIKGLGWQNNKLGLILFGFSPKESKIPYQLDVVNFISQMVLSCNSTILIDI